MTNDLDKLVASKAQAWLDGNYDEATKQEVRFLMENNHNELVELGGTYAGLYKLQFRDDVNK